MQEVKAYPVGTFCWLDLGTTDREGAKQFYTALFGWNTQDEEMEDGNIYTSFTLMGKYVAGMYEMDAKERETTPPNWFSNISVDDAAAHAQKVKDLGGKVLMDPFPVKEQGIISVVMDPTGAAFGLWQPGTDIGAQVVNQPNTWVWNHLVTRDVEAAVTFYTGLFGWTKDTQPDSDAIGFTNKGRMAASAMNISKDQGDIPPHWSVFFHVEDCDAMVVKTQELGGTAVMPPMDMKDIGRMAMLQDPQGAYFHIITSIHLEPPPGYENN